MPGLLGPKDKIILQSVGNNGLEEVAVQIESSEIKLGNVNFGFGSTVLSADAKKLLKEVAQKVIKHGFTSIALNGHADSIASNPNVNDYISSNRSEAAKAYLSNLLKGKDVEISVAAFSDKKPLADNTSATARAVNRRVEILVK